MCLLSGAMSLHHLVIMTKSSLSCLPCFLCMLAIPIFPFLKFEEFLIYLFILIIDGSGKCPTSYCTVTNVHTFPHRNRKAQSILVMYKNATDDEYYCQQLQSTSQSYHNRQSVGSGLRVKSKTCQSRAHARSLLLQHGTQLHDYTCTCIQRTLIKLTPHYRYITAS